MAGLLAGCAGAPAAKVLPFPSQVGGFERTEAPVQGRSGVLAGYHTGAAGTDGLVTTVQRRPAPSGGELVPLLGRGDGAADDIANGELTRSVAQIRRFFPDAAAGPVEAMLVLRAGALRPGRRVTVRYRADAGSPPMQIDIAVLCCTTDHEVVEFRFRHAASTPPAIEEAAFIRRFPWTTAEAEALSLQPE